MPSVGLQAFCLALMVNGVFGSAAGAAALSGPRANRGAFFCLDISSEIPCNQAAGRYALRGFGAMWQVPI